MSACIASGLLEGYCRGEAPAEQQRFVEAHCASCESCRHRLEAVAFATPPTSVEELAAEAELLGRISSLRPVDRFARSLLAEHAAASGPRDENSQPPSSRPPAGVGRRPLWARPRVRLAAVAGGAAIAASLVLVFSNPSGAPPSLALQYRAAEGRPALVHLEHVPFVPLRGEDRDPPEYDRALGWLLSRPASERAKTSRYLAALYLWRGEQGDRARAEAALRASPESARRDNDIGVMLLASGEAEGALMAFSGALEKDPGLIEAQFNLGLALEATGQKAAAAEAWEDYLRRATGSGERAWAEEARHHRDALLQENGAGSE